MITSLGAAAFFNQLAMLVVQIVLNKSLTYYGAHSDYGESIPLACAGIITKVNQVFFDRHRSFAGHAADPQVSIMARKIMRACGRCMGWRSGGDLRCRRCPLRVSS